MFEITIPLMVDGNCGASDIFWGDDYESFGIYKSEDVKIVDFVKIWQAEAEAVSRGRRKRGILPSNIQRNRDGRLGCRAGWAIFREADGIHVHDQTIGFSGDDATFGTSPHEWWRCLNSSYRKWPGLKTIPVSALKDWSERLYNLLHTLNIVVDEERYKLEIKEGNAVILDSTLRGLTGGSDLHLTFPPDTMERMGFVMRCRGKNRAIVIDGDAAVYQFDGSKLFPGRDMEELVWWIDMVFQHGDMVIFLDPQGNAGKGVPLWGLKPGDDVAEVLPGMLETTQIVSEAIDHVAFSAHCELSELLRNGGHVVLPKTRYRRLLKGASRVLLGICKGTGWAEFPLGKIIHRPIQPLFKENADSTDLLQEVGSR